MSADYELRRQRLRSRSGDIGSVGCLRTWDYVACLFLQHLTLLRPWWGTSRRCNAAQWGLGSQPQRAAVLDRPTSDVMRLQMNYPGKPSALWRVLEFLFGGNMIEGTVKTALWVLAMVGLLSWLSCR